MTNHPYLRAYLAGVALPTAFMPVIFCFFCVLRYWLRTDVPIERVIVFPLALVPNAWGLWNVLRLRLPARARLPLGVHGALLVLILATGGCFVGAQVREYLPPYFFEVLAMFVPVGMIGYYIVWKYVVGFFNAQLGVAA